MSGKPEIFPLLLQNTKNNYFTKSHLLLSPIKKRECMNKNNTSMHDSFFLWKSGNCPARPAKKKKRIPILRYAARSPMRENPPKQGLRALAILPNFALL